MRKKSRIIWFLFAVFIMTIAFGASMPGVTSAAGLIDVQGHLAATQINTMVGQGIVNGYPKV